MSDLSDVMAALVSVVAGAVYPNGPQEKSSVVVNGVALPVAIYPGWPIPAQLDADLATNKTNVSIFAPPGMERNTTRYPRNWSQVTPAAVTITAALAGNSVTLGGSITLPQNVAIIVDGIGYLHSVAANEGLSDIATALAGLINQDTPASASGAVITIPDASEIIPRVGGVGLWSKEVRRQNRLFQITFWCPPVYGSDNPSATRDTIVSLVDPVLAELNFLSLPNGESGRLVYVRTSLDDGLERANCYRRDLFYTVEYGTTVLLDAPQALVIRTTFQGSPAPFADFTPTEPPPITVTT